MKNAAIIKGFLAYIMVQLRNSSGLLKLLLVIIFLNGPGAFAQVGVHTDFPDASSAMEIYSTTKGLLIPRVTLSSSLLSPSPVTAPVANGLLVFNSGSNQALGFYYWNSTLSSWVLIGGGSSSGNYWSITGNAGTVPATNFLGTTDNQHLAIRTNNTERMRIEDDGQIVIGSTVPLAATHALTVYGNSTQNFAIAAFSPTVGFYNFGGRYGVFSQVDTACTPNPGFAVWAKNTDVSSYGIYAVGSNVSSLPLITSHTAGITSYGFDGLHAWGRNTTTGHGLCAIGSGQNSSFALTNISAGISSVGNYGIITRGTSTTGRGIVAIGSGLSTPSTSLESEGGAFTGFHGIFGSGSGYQTTPVLMAGIGVIGIGYNASSYSTLAGGLGLGGSFTGEYGVYGKGVKTDGVGVLGVGSNGSGYYTLTNGSGGAFTGYHGSLSVGINVAAGMGVVGAGNNSAYVILPQGAGGVFTGITIGAGGFGTSPTTGIGLIGAGNNQAVWVPSNGCGGAFIGTTGVFSRSSSTTGTGVVGVGNNQASPGTFANGAGGTFTGTSAGSVSWATAGTGTAVIGAGNNITAPLTYTGGSGGAFTGTAAGAVAYGTTAASGVGIIGLGNNITTAQLPGTSGCGGAFSGTTWGVYGYAASSANVNKAGGYFTYNPAGTAYSYVCYRSSGGTNNKIIGTGTVSTIVKDTHGDLIALYCPEAPEVVFQDYGIGQLVNGFAHINIDPDLTLNINVSENHPLKVYITPEGDCSGVYVTNKSANGFDVIELQGGKSNVQFSWQIVATRANEEYVLRDGTVELSDYSMRFGPAPGPLEMTEQPAQTSQINNLEIIQLEKVMSEKGNEKVDQTMKGATLQATEDSIIEVTDDPDE